MAHRSQAEPGTASVVIRCYNEADHIGGVRPPRSAFSVTPTEIEVVGVFEPLDSDADEWVGSGLPQVTAEHQFLAQSVFTQGQLDD